MPGARTGLTVEFGDLAGLDRTFVCGEDDDGNDTSSQVTPSLHGEGESEKHSSSVGRGAIGDGSGRHGIVSSDSDTHNHTHNGDPGEDADRSERERGCDEQDRSDNGDDQTCGPNATTAEDVSKKTKPNLTNDASQVCCCLQGTSL